jgi:hypothetical protein
MLITLEVNGWCALPAVLSLVSQALNNVDTQQAADSELSAFPSECERMAGGGGLAVSIMLNLLNNLWMVRPATCQALNSVKLLFSSCHRRSTM